MKKDGTLKWDHSIELKNIRTFSLRQYTLRQSVGDSALMVYATPEALIAGKYHSEDGSGKEDIVRPGGNNTVYSQITRGPEGRIFVSGIRDKVFFQSGEQVRQRIFFVDELRP